MKLELSCWRFASSHNSRIKNATFAWVSAYRKNGNHDSERTQDPGLYEDTISCKESGLYEDPGSYEDPGPYEDPGFYEDSKFFDDPGKTQEFINQENFPDFPSHFTKYNSPIMLAIYWELQLNAGLLSACVSMWTEPHKICKVWARINQVLSRCSCSFGLWLNKSNHRVKQVDINKSTIINQSISMNWFYPIEAFIFIQEFFIFP